MNNLTLLRPFDLEKAKAGDAICTREGTPVRFIVHVPEITKGVVVVCGDNTSVSPYWADGRYWADHDEEYDLAMAPLTWLDGKPVYKGDTLWYTASPKFNVFSISVTGLNMRDGGNGLEGTVLERIHGRYSEPGELIRSPFYCWSWDRPEIKVKKEAWVNVYSNTSSGLWGSLYSAKDIADLNATTGRRACVRIEWEE